MFAQHQRTRGRTARRRLAAAITVVGVASAGVALATIPPSPGHSFPEKFIEFQQSHPELFVIRGGLRNVVERARQRRADLLGSNEVLSFDPAAGEVITSSGKMEIGLLAVTGTVRVPVVPVAFTPATTPAPPTATRISEILFTGPNPPSGTAADYYDEVSYGLLTLTGDVFAYTNLPSGDTTYEGTNNGLPGGGDSGLLMQQALNGVDPTVDFGMYDNDGPDGVPNSGDDDGLVDLISFIQPERGGECGTSNIWSHRWTYSGWFGSPYTTNDPRSGGGFIRINDYNIQAGLDCSNNEMDIGTFAHETGHIFGIPDLYDTATVAPSQGIGYWSLMASGGWNTAASPAHMSAWEKSELGWLIPTLLTSTASNVSLQQVETSARALEIAVGNGEMFLIENRQKVGFDQFLKTCGLAIWHVDQGLLDVKTASNTVNNKQNCGSFVESPGQHYGLALEQADGLCHLEANANRGDAGDLYPGSSGKTSFTETTTPNSDAYVSGPTDVRVTNISACGATMTIDVDAFPVYPPTVNPVDVVFLIDNTGSYSNDWPNIKSQMPGIVAKLQAAFSDVRYGLALFRDFPFTPYGSPGDFAYRVELPLTGTASSFLSAVNTMQNPGGGADQPEAQYEAMYQLLFGLGKDLYGNGIKGDEPGEINPSNIGWLPNRHRIIYLLTDADFHDSDAESYPTGTSTTPTPTLEAAGRNQVRSGIIALISGGTGITLFTLVAENPDAFITQGEDGSLPNLPQSRLQGQAQELADQTSGGVYFVGPSSAQFDVAVASTIGALRAREIATGGRKIPTISGLGMAALLSLLLLLGILMLRRKGAIPGR